MSFNQTEYITSFIRENYDQIMVKVPKGRRKVLKELSTKTGMPMNQLIITAVEEKYKIDLTTKMQ